ncbi:MAG: lysozyme inhibitor LprI family protein [Xanthobacteraceae bacterium]
MRGPVSLLLLLAGVVSAIAQPQRPAREICDPKTLSGRPYYLCLEKAMLDSNRELEALVSRIYELIDSRGDLAAAQRGRWKASLEEAQILFVRFRNQVCQAVAPFEGPTWQRVGTFEERLRCLIDKNIVRRRDLEARYTK